MRYSLNQGSADSVPVSPLLFPATRCVFATFRSFRPAPLRKSRRFMLLRALELSCRSFCNSDPLFSTACTLFCQNAGGVGMSLASRCDPWTLSGSRRRLPPPEMPLRDSPAHQLLCFLSHPCNSSGFMQLRTLSRNGAQLSLLFSTASTLFLSPRGWYPCDLCLP